MGIFFIFSQREFFLSKDLRKTEKTLPNDWKLHEKCRGDTHFPRKVFLWPLGTEQKVHFYHVFFGYLLPLKNRNFVKNDRNYMKIVPIEWKSHGESVEKNPSVDFLFVWQLWPGDQKVTLFPWKTSFLLFLQKCSKSHENSANQQQITRGICP